MTLATPSIADQVDASADGQYWPSLPADDEVFSVKVVSELKCAGIAQNLTPIYLLITASWGEVQACLTRATMSWQTKMWGFEDGLGVQHGEWMYEVLQGQTSEQGWKDLTTEKELRSLRKRVVDGNVDVQVVLWHEVMYAEMKRRTEWLKHAQAEDLVDFHNACYMDISLSLPSVDAEGAGIQDLRCAEEHEGSSSDHCSGLQAA